MDLEVLSLALESASTPGEQIAAQARLMVRWCRLPLSNPRAVQVAPIKPTSKTPGTIRLKLKYDQMPSSFAFNFHLRRYIVAFLASHPDKAAEFTTDGAGARVRLSGRPWRILLATSSSTF